MIKESDIKKGDLVQSPDEAWNMRKVIWHIYDLAMKHFQKDGPIPGWKMKFVRSKAQAITFYREGQSKDLKEILTDLQDKEKLFKGTIFEPYMLAIMDVALGQPAIFKKQGGGKWDGGHA